jgi:hypothetical protein
MKRIIQISLPVDVNVLKVALQWQCCVVLLHILETLYTSVL